MKAKLSLKGILNQWHLNCLCWDRFQKSRTLSNMLGRISHSSDFLSRVNNTICRDIFIHRQSLQRSLLPLTHIMYSLISIRPWGSSYRTSARLSAIPTVAAGGAAETIRALHPRYRNVTFPNFQCRKCRCWGWRWSGDWWVIGQVFKITFLFTQKPDSYTTRRKRWSVCRNHANTCRLGVSTGRGGENTDPRFSP